MLPNANDLIYFVESATSLNISRAAERLGISQPTLSLAIQRLEHSVGAQLLLRSKKGVSLTQAGKLLLAHSRELLQKWDAIRGKARATQQQISGAYTIGVHPSVALYSLPDALPDLLENFPELELRLRHDLSRKIAESVIRLETDIGVVVNPVKHPDLVIKKICEDEVTFWVAPGKRRIQDFGSGQAILICDPELLQTQDLLTKIKRAGISFSRILASSNLEVITRLTAKGAGVGIIPGRVAVQASTLKRVPGAPVFKDEISILYRMENRAVLSIQRIAEAIEKALR